MLPQCNSLRPLFEYSYIDLEGNTFGPFDGCKMAGWDRKGHFDDDLIIFRKSASGKTERFFLRDLKRRSKFPFLEFDDPANEDGGNQIIKMENISSDITVPFNENQETHNTSPFSQNREKLPDGSARIEFSKVDTLHTISADEMSISNRVLSNRNPEGFKIDSFKIESIISTSPIQANNKKADLLTTSVRGNYYSDRYPPFMRLPDHRGSIMKPESARSKVFNLYQLIISVPEQVKHFPPYTNEKVSCQLCRVDLIGPEMFKHLIEIQHLMKVSNCLFTEKDVDYWIDRIHNVIKLAPAKSISLCGFAPTLNLNETESVASFINRTKGFTRRPSTREISKPMNVISVTLDVDVAAAYATKPSNKEKRKLSGRFVSQVVETLIEGVDRRAFKRKFSSLQRILEKHNACGFCMTQFYSFYDACMHIASLGHREQISNIHYDERIVAIWVRLLALPNKRSCASGSSNCSSLNTSSLNDVNHN